ncbi:CHAT domain-containing protein [Infundibulicybe gibba]|nr:CHAT domain-containing protein [Infundibulicybe gibba]
MPAAFTDEDAKFLDEMLADPVLFQAGVQRVLQTIPSVVHSPEFSRLQDILASMYQFRFEQQNSMQDLDAALKHSELALTSTYQEVSMIPFRHQRLALLLSDRYKRLGDISDNQLALKHDLLAVELTADDDPLMQQRLQNLAVGYSDNYRYSGNLKDLEASIKYSRKALDKTPPGHPFRASNQRTLANTYMTDPELPHRQQALAVAYHERFWRFKDLTDLEKSIDLKSVASARGSYKASQLFSKRFDSTHNIDDIHAALRNDYTAIFETPPLHPELAHRQLSLAAAHGSRYKVLKDPSDLDLNIKFNHDCLNGTPRGHPQASQSVATSLHATTNDTWNTARRWGFISAKHNLPECIGAYSIALSSVADLLWVGNTISVRHDVILQQEVPLVVARAVKACVDEGKLKLAAEFLEQDLQSQFPTHAQKLKDISLRLQNSKASAEELQGCAIDRKALISDVRALPGFSNFLAATPYNQLKAGGQCGPVVMLNYTISGCDALILMPGDGLRHVPLVGVTRDGIFGQLEKVRGYLNNHSIQSRDDGKHRYGRPSQRREVDHHQRFQEVLSWLAGNVIKPIYDTLNDAGIRGGRIWWCASGPFTYLPLHAAPTSDEFIPSYTPTVGSLIRARSEMKKASTLSPRHMVTIIGVPEIPGRRNMNLPSVSQEVKVITGRVGKQRTKCLVGKKATVENVAAQLRSSRWLHLGCHGQQSALDPLQSGLILYDGQLSLNQIIRMQLHDAEFVFLSACQTAMGDAKLPNEAMHLAGGMIFAGFKGAIGTLWNMADSDGPAIAETATEVAGALQAAVRKLRADGLSFERWVPFVHIGV